MLFLSAAPNDAPPEVTVIYGWAFIGSAVYFIYGLIFPKWSNAIGQLLGTIAYDAVLIGPLLSLLSELRRLRLRLLAVLRCLVEWVDVVFASAAVAGNTFALADCRSFPA